MTPITIPTMAPVLRLSFPPPLLLPSSLSTGCTTVTVGWSWRMTKLANEANVFVGAILKVRFLTVWECLCAWELFR